MQMKDENRNSTKIHMQMHHSNAIIQYANGYAKGLNGMPRSKNSGMDQYKHAQLEEIEE